MEEAPNKPLPTHVAMLPTPGMGHLIPFIELARKLNQQHNFITITFILPDDGLNMKPQKALLKSINFINTIFLPPVNFDDLPENTTLETRISLTVIRSLHSVRESLSQLNESIGLSAFIVDMFGALSFDVVKDLGVPLYIFFTSAAMILSLALHFPKLDELTDSEYRDLPEPVKIPGCVPVHGSDFPDTLQDKKSQTYEGMLELCRKYQLAEGILVNGFLDLEPDIYKAFEAQDHGLGGINIPPVYPVGPLVRTRLGDNNEDDKVECLKWLDEQPNGSVLFVSFGSGGTLSREQLKELGLGLEMSGQRFLWVVKSPSHDKVKYATYFTFADDDLDPLEFIERTNAKGFLLAQWAPQIEILSHRAVGGFVTHCGWNSTLESIIHGVPLIAWPLFAEQKMNAVLLSEDLKVAFRVRENENGVVDSEQIAKLGTSLIEGEEGMELRNRIRNIQGAAIQALSQDGHSTKSLAKVVEKWIN
ncbi:hypothetical protein ACJIZ3_004168 [Penstemon smallii]|uniref:Glycosyltransferase n=1 Tax=Penstemon smallii TaxID=265156 RepID=A0ABD3S1H9_9LAMI